MEELLIMPEILGFYQKFGWRLDSILLVPPAFAAVDEETRRLLGGAPIIEAEVSAAWFTRPSTNFLEAWELRLLSAQQFAVFETFPADLPLEELDDARSEMEVRLIEYVTGKPRSLPPPNAAAPPSSQSKPRRFFKKK